MKVKTFFLVLIFAAHFCKSQNLKITVNNKTGFDLDSVIICDKKIGFMKKDTSLLLLNCKGLNIQDGANYVYSKHGVIIGKSKCKDFGIMPWCGTGMERVDEGWYEINIMYYENKNGCYGLGFAVKDKKKKQ